jgi:hypothetical protein
MLCLKERARLFRDGQDASGGGAACDPPGYGITAFVDNAADRKGITTANNLPPDQEFLVRPRTVGITVDYRL